MTPFRIKCCGITRIEDGLLAAQLGFDALGLVFARRSPRRVSLAQALEIRVALPRTVTVVALFMDNDAAEVADVVAQLEPNVLQFHGGESNDWCDRFARPWIKALAMGGGGDVLAQLSAYPDAAALLLDGHVAGEPGGAGKAFDWSRLPGQMAQPWILAGGLNADNVAAAIRMAHPWGVDVSSGVESAPGRKDPARMQDFAAAVRRAAQHFAKTS